MDNAPIKTLLLTDSATVNRVIKSALNSDRYELVEVTSKDKGFFEAIVDAKPDLVILRTVLENGNGLQVCDRIRGEESLKATRIVFLSGDSKVREQAIHHRADQFLTMPFTPQDVGKALQPLFVQKTRLLYVDDSDIFHKIVTPAFREEGYLVYEAWDGREAIELVDSEDIDVIVSDVEMPTMDGITMCSSIKGSMERDIPILLLTSETSDAGIQRGFDAGADDYLIKPVVIPELLSRVKRMLNASHGRMRPERILVVDDSEMIRSMVGTALRSNGFKVDDAEHGAAALVKLMEAEYQLMVTDYEMPHMDGVELVSRQRQRETSGRKLPIIFATQRNSQTDQVKMRSLGIQAYVAKPFTSDRIVAEVERVLAEARLEERRAVMREYFSEATIHSAQTENNEKNMGEDQFRTALSVGIARLDQIQQELAAPELVSLVNTFFDHMLQAVQPYRLTIESLGGDGILALVGRDDDDALRAARAALAFAQAAEGFAKKVNRDVQVQVAVHSGHMMLANLGSRFHQRRFTALGETLDVLRRLRCMAPLNGVLVSDTTLKMVRDKVSVRPLDPYVNRERNLILPTVQLNAVTWKE
ncbi:MAG: response regulator [Magnetococcus sp. WYHC-3]